MYSDRKVPKYGICILGASSIFLLWSGSLSPYRLGEAFWEGPNSGEKNFNRSIAD